MNTRVRILKAAGKVLLVLALLLITALLAVFIRHRAVYRRNMDFLTENGYYSPVSAGNCTLNLLKTGNENGRHRIVFLSGIGSCSSISAKDFADRLRDREQVIFLSRAGYDAGSYDKKDMTAERVVEDYRKALENAGVQKPYMLMAHSLGGVFATYWVSRYPDEIEALVIIDGTCVCPISDVSVNVHRKLSYYLANMGILDFTFHLAELPKPYLNDDDQRAYDIMRISTLSSGVLDSERANWGRNLNDTWNVMVPNDVPKIFISAIDGFRTEEDVEKYGDLNEKKIAELTPGFTGSDEERRKAACRAFLGKCAQSRERLIEPYAEKLGSCKLIYLAGDHFIFNQRTDECADIIKGFIAELE